MGGAERSARKKRQAAVAGRPVTPPPSPAPAPAPTRPAGNRKKIVIGAVVVVLLAAAVVGGIIYTNAKKNATEGQTIAVSRVDAGYPAVRQGAIVTVGQDSADTIIDVFEDFLCPACGSFEETYGKQIHEQLAEGTVRVRYHMLPMLDDRSDPAGYSMDSANAALCAADAGQFPDFHQSLFDAQPAEGARGWDNQQLVQLGTNVGVTSPEFRSCVESGEYDDAVAAHFAEVREMSFLQQEVDGQRGFGTPTIAVGDTVVNTGDENWLKKLVD